MRVLLRNFAIGFLCCLGFTVFPARACQGEVRLNEILADPASDWTGDGVTQFRDDEWVEIVNTGPLTASLDGLFLADASNIFRFGFTGTLAPGAVLIIFGTDSVAWETSNGASTVGLSLNNAGDTVRLFHVVAAETLVVDEHIYAAHEGLDDRSTGRQPDGADNWVVFDGLNPYTGSTAPLGTGCRPTPGAQNGCPLPVAPATWTGVKRLYATESESSPDKAGVPASPSGGAPRDRPKGER